MVYNLEGVFCSFNGAFRHAFVGKYSSTSVQHTGFSEEEISNDQQTF